MNFSGFATIRERAEALEAQILSPYASLSSLSKGRERPEPADDVRPVYQRDRDRILHSKSFRRLKHKTQVFLAPWGDHYRTRLTHTLEVSQISRTIAKSLMLNESLTEAIALGHDLGHTPFGHSGEAVLDRLCKSGFKHNEQSLRIVELIEKNGEGLNLSWEVRDGILNHQISGNPSTLEGHIVRISDKIAYLNHDIDDALRAGILKESDIPTKCTLVLGQSVNARLSNLIHNVIYNSMDRDCISMSPDFNDAMLSLRRWMFENLYTGGKAKEEEGKAQQMLELLFDYYMKHPDEMSEESLQFIRQGTDRERAVCDYISGMTDNYAIEKFQELFVPNGWRY